MNKFYLLVVVAFMLINSKTQICYANSFPEFITLIFKNEDGKDIKYHGEIAFPSQTKMVDSQLEVVNYVAKYIYNTKKHITKPEQLRLATEWIQYRERDSALVSFHIVDRKEEIVEDATYPPHVDPDGNVYPAMKKSVHETVLSTHHFLVDLITGDIYEFGENHDETYNKFIQSRKNYLLHPDRDKIIAEKVKLFKEKNPPPATREPEARPRIPEGWPADQPEGKAPIPGKRGELALAILGMKDAKEWDKLSDKYSDAMTRARQAFQARVNPGKNNNSLTDEQMQEYWKNKDSQLWKEYLEVKKYFIQLHDMDRDGVIEGSDIKVIQDRYLKLRELRESDSDAGTAELIKIEIEYFDFDGDGALNPAEYKLAERFIEKLLVIPSKFGSHDKVFKEDY